MCTWAYVQDDNEAWILSSLRLHQRLKSHRYLIHGKYDIDAKNIFFSLMKEIEAIRLCKCRISDDAHHIILVFLTLKTKKIYFCKLRSKYDVLFCFNVEEKFDVKMRSVDNHLSERIDVSM